MDKSRAQWSSRLGFILAAAGSAIGLGNIWKFPGRAYEGGGGIYLLIYLAMVIFFGVPLMMTELAIGRASQANVVAAFRTLARSGASGAREDLARALGFRANALRGAGRFDEARADFAEATAEIRRMAEDEPGAYALSLGTVLGNAAALDAETGRPESARALAEEALSVLEAREREEPGSCAQPLGQIRILLEKLGAPAAGTCR